MSLLTEQEMQAMWNTASSYNPVWMWHLAYARDIEAKARAKLIEEIKAQGPSAWLHCERKDSDIVTDAVKHVWGKAVVGSLALYNIPLYKLPKGD